MRPTLSPLALALAALMLGACTPASQDATADAAKAGAAAPATSEAAPNASAAAAPAQSPADPLDAILAGDWRDPANAARDAFRHPRETLAFFGVGPSQTVIEISPGGGWYTEVLAPLAQGKGRYIGALNDPAKASSERATEYHTKANQGFRDKLAARADVYGNASVVEVDPAAPVFGEAGSADVVLTFRNVHNWVSDKSLDDKLRGCFLTLKPGGELGVVDHRAAPGTTLEAMAKSGYVTEAFMEERARAAGFVLAAKSEINANAKDTKDHPNGVWTLPPTFARKEVERERYAAIGESDRFTHRYVKPA